MRFSEVSRIFPKYNEEFDVGAEARLHGLVDLSNEDYHAGPGVSKSKLDTIATSELAYWDAYVNPDREPQPYKHCFAVGDGTHKVVLEPGTFEDTYAVGFDKSAYPDALDSSADLKKACSEQGLMVSGTKPELADRLIHEAGFAPERIMLELEKLHNRTMAGKIAIPSRDYKDMLNMLRAVEKHHTAAGLLRNAYVEQSFFVEIDQYWTNPATGVIEVIPKLRKCRTDAISADGRIIPDLKTTDDVSEDGFGRTIAQRRYHVQAAWYLDILFALYGKDAPSVFSFIAVQKTRPYDVAVHYLTDEQIQVGRLLYQRDLARLTEAERLNYWPGQDKGRIIQAKLPAWEMNKLLYGI